MKALAWIVGAAVLVLFMAMHGCGNDCRPADSTNAAGRAFITGGAER